MEFPETLKYSKDHAWLALEGDLAKIGITDFAQNELGEIVYVDLPRIGQTFKLNEIYGSVEAVKTTSDLFMPVSCQVVEINPRLKDEPTLINSSPSSEGWILKIKLENAIEVNSLLSGGEYKASVNG